MIFKTQNKIIDNIVNKKSSIKINIIKKMYNEIIDISNNISNSINNILKVNTINLYEKKTSISDGLVFHLKNAIYNSTHEKTTSYLNINKQSNISRQAYENRSQLFSYNELKIINNNLFINNLNNNIDNKSINL